MGDFCLGPEAMNSIARLGDMLVRMSERAGIPTDAARIGDAQDWYEARLRCIGCAVSRQCTRFLASPAAAEGGVASFCANRAFLTEQNTHLTSGRRQ
jgi:hypothetical protein